MSQDVLNLEEAAKYLKVAAVTLGRQVRAGEVPGRKVGNQWRFSREALGKWLQNPPERGQPK